MRIMKFIIVTIVVLTTTAVNAQEIQRWNSNYKVGDIEYTKPALLQFLEVDSTSHALFKKGLKQQKTANISGGVSLAMIATGAILVDKANKEGCYLCGTIFTGAAFILFSGIPGLIGIGNQIGATKNKRKAIKFYNEKYGYLPTGEEGTSIHYRITPHGIGLTYHF